MPSTYNRSVVGVNPLRELFSPSARLDNQSVVQYPAEMDKTSGMTRAVLAAGSQGKLAELLGVSQQAISKWEARGWVPLARARQIAAAFPIPLKDLLDPDTAELIP